MKHRKKKRSFTLLEMLVVIAIIGILAGILLPVLSQIIRHTKKTRAREAMYQVRVAFKQYLVDYRKFPAEPISQVDSNVLAILSGSASGPMLKYAYLGHKYMDVSTNEMVVGLKDPWGNLYMLSVDNGMGGDTTPAYDQKVGAGPNYPVIEDEVVLWSKGEDGSDAKANQKDDVRSW